MKKKIVNLTPHPVRLICEQCEVVIQSSGSIRLSESAKKISEVNVGGCSISVFEKTLGAGELPPERDDTIIIVSLPVAQAFPERKDLVVPNGLVRDEQGRVIGATSLARVR